MNMKTTSAKPLIKRSAARLVVMALAATGSALAGAPIAAAERLTQVRMSIDEDPIVLRLANSLGYFNSKVKIDQLYDNRFVRNAMREL